MSGEPAARLAPGVEIGPYRITAAIGAGAMGDVYRAHDPRLGRDVAIKVMKASAESDRMARFEREARATAVLAHPNIVTVFDVGTHNGAPFLVTELLHGRTLRERLAEGTVSLREAIDWTLALARGAAAAHGLQIVHRDLKPENLFLTSDGALKILDFGLAKLDPTPLVDAAETTVVSSTEPGTLLGTLAYMAPEQVRGEPVDERADLFSIGAILYEMIAGRAPFARRTAADTVAAILRESPAPLTEAAEAMPALERLIRRCLEKDPAERFPNAGDLARALESLLSGSGSPVGARQPAATPGAKTSIAVLPFADMSPARDQDWLCEGIAEELIHALTHVDGLRVAARSSSFRFRAQDADARAVGERLGVTNILEGSVRRLGDRLRVSVQLVDVTDGYQRWAERFDRAAEDVFAIQDEIAESVATALRGMLDRREKEALQRPGTALEAYEYYLRGRQLLHRWQRATNEQACAMFERALEIDPQYAPAWAGLSLARSWAYEWWHGTADHLAAADAASRKALELRGDLSEAHTARGLSLSLERRYDEAAAEFEEAIRLNPSSFDALHAYARTCFADGRIEESADLFQRAAEARAEDFQSLILRGQSLRVLGRAEEAAAANREGIRRAERQLDLDPADVRALSLGANALFDDGRPEQALAWSRRALELAPEDGAVLVNAACLRARLGDKEEALDLLERTFACGWGKRDWIENDPDYDNLRDDPRFHELLAKLN